MPTQTDIRQSVLRSALNMAGSAVNATVDGILTAFDPLIAKLFEDRNILLSDGGTITFTGTQVQFTENLKITLNQKISGAVPQVISLGSANQNFTSSGDMLVAVLNRTAGTASLSIVASGSALSAVSNANQEVFLIAKRVDAGDGTQRLYWRNGFAQNAGQTLRLGQGGGSGSGVGGGSDLNSLQFRAQFIESFTESTTSAVSAVNGSAGFTNAVYSAAKQMFTINYDASKTANTTGTAVTMSGAPAYTVVAGDVLVNLATLEVKKITVVTSQTSYTIESAFASNLAAQAVCVSQAVHTKDIYNYTANSTAAALSAAFPGSTFSEILVDYEDNAASNSNLWTPDTAPFVAFVASTDNSAWTTSQTRATNETDTMQSDVCPTAGSDLFIRFFSAKTSGSGFVNLLNYEAFMQKSLASTQGGIVWSAYAMSNSSTTPLNCSLSVVGGKTTITFTSPNQYAVGVNPGQAYGVLDVYVNGQMIPRFVAGSVPSADGFYTELSGSAIQLDKDYSSVALDIQIVLRTQIVDTSTTNTTSISVLQSVIAQSLNDFVDTSNLLSPVSTSGTPVAGTFYSQISNRASLIDLSQDLKVRMGVNRIMTQSVSRIQNEVGPNGESVWGIQNDPFGEVRLFGQWNYQQEGLSSGPYIFANASGDTAEITFYGTGINLLAFLDNTARNWAVQIDGGGYGSNLSQTVSAVQLTTNYGANNVLNVASGLALGIHTLSIKNTSGFAMWGYEVLNESSQLKVTPGSSYINGSKLTSAVLSSISYNSGFASGTLGTRGGRALIYQTSAGSIASAVTPVPTTASAFSFAGTGYSGVAANHTNEEIARVISWREFGAGRFGAADDFSTVGTASTSRHFTLDDDSTTLVGSAIIQSTVNADALAFAGTASFWELTFVGTGLDVVNSRGATITDSYTITVDGTAVVTATLGTTLFGGGTLNIAKIVSGLPYGSHTVRVTCSTSVGVGVNIPQFIIYQPKTPSLPSGANELARYNVLANFTANNTASTSSMSGGVLRKNTIRESIFTGTWSAGGTNTGNIGGASTSSSTTGDKVSFTFFGTGFDFRIASTGTSYTATMTIDGSTNFNISNGSFWTGALTTSFYGTGLTSFAAGTGIITTTTTPIGGNGCIVQGLNLGVHTVTITKGATGATTLVPEAFDIITPIHSYKLASPSQFGNFGLIGSQSVQDGRNFSLLAVPSAQSKAWAQATGISTSPTTTSATDVMISDMIASIKTNGGPIKISYSLWITATTGTQLVTAYIDGIPQNISSQQFITPSSGSAAATAMSAIFPVSAGVHTIQLFWRTSAGTATASGALRTMTVEEL